jgi:hypothetical protein
VRFSFHDNCTNAGHARSEFSLSRSYVGSDNSVVESRVLGLNPNLLRIQCVLDGFDALGSIQMDVD